MYHLFRTDILIFVNWTQWTCLKPLSNNTQWPGPVLSRWVHRSRYYGYPVGLLGEHMTLTYTLYLDLYMSNFQPCQKYLPYKLNQRRQFLACSHYFDWCLNPKYLIPLTPGAAFLCTYFGPFRWGAQVLKWDSGLCCEWMFPQYETRIWILPSYTYEPAIHLVLPKVYLFYTQKHISKTYQKYHFFISIKSIHLQIILNFKILRIFVGMQPSVLL